MKPELYYFGPLYDAGHYFHSEGGGSLARAEEGRIPWRPEGIDCVLQPGCGKERRGSTVTPQNQGEALIHHKDGWTAMSFWDRTVDERMNCNSTYIAKGLFSFEEMLEMARTRFAKRWNMMGFPVRLAPGAEDGKMFYIMAQGPIGNSARWWGPDRGGYTCDLNLAGKYSRSEAESICRNKERGETMHACAVVDAIAQRHVDVHTLWATQEKPEVATK